MSVSETMQYFAMIRISTLGDLISESLATLISNVLRNVVGSSFTAA